MLIINGAVCKDAFPLNTYNEGKVLLINKEGLTDDLRAREAYKRFVVGSGFTFDQSKHQNDSHSLIIVNDKNI